jgi:hypothetical protein
MTKYVSITDMVGRQFEKITVTDDAIHFEDALGCFTFYHEQDCCEAVYIESIVGDVSDLLNTPLLVAEEVSGKQVATEDGTGTWTFYKFATIKGYVDVRWYGESNGFYSESVYLMYKEKNT